MTSTSSQSPRRSEADQERFAFKAVPGTEILFDEHDHLQHLEHIAKGDTRILLVPQPSKTDPNDPLRWSTTKKAVVFFHACFYAFMGSITGPIMAAGMIQLSEFFDKTLQEMTYANGATLVCQGVFNIIWMPFAIKYGRRPVYIFSTFLMLLACVWLGIASTRNYTVFIVGRAFLGIWEAPIESIVPSTITDMYFLHNRGFLVSLYGLSVLGGNELGPMFSAFIIQALGMNWAFFIVAMFIGVGLVGVIFAMPETKFTGPRPAIMIAQQPQTPDETLDKKRAQEVATAEEVPRKSYLQELSFWSKGDPNVNLLHVALRPLVLLAYPSVVWSCAVYGMALSWNVILGASVALLFAPPPYGFNSNAQGLFFLSPFVGSLFGTYLSGPMGDWIANWATKRNNGIREPEMRLPTCLVAAFLTFFGALWFGLAYEHQTHWAVPVIGAGVLSAGAQMGATLGMNYALDCHQELSVEIMVTIASLKSLIAWIWTWEINNFIDASGPLTVFMTVAAINVVVYLTSVPFYLYGKRWRLWLHRKDLLRGLP